MTTDEPEVTLQQQIACIERELAIRRGVYGQRVANGKMKAETAHFELEAMKAVLRTLTKLQETENARRTEYQP